jgi:cell wall-associated NlpC family hydrolase
LIFFRTKKNGIRRTPDNKQKVGMQKQKLKYDDLLGAKFTHGGNSIEEGFDCWSLCREVYRRLGRDLYEYKHLAEQVMADEKFQYKNVDALIRVGAENFQPLQKPEPFCLVTFIMLPPFVTHIGVVLEDKRYFIHILKQSSVSVERLDSLLWATKIDGYWRYGR